MAMKKENRDQMQCKQLSENDVISDRNYREIAKLVYHTDPFIYPPMFGEGEEGILCASKVLPALFETNQDEMFSKKNLYVIESDEQVMGLILWYKGTLRWNSELILRIADQMGIFLDREIIEVIGKEYVEACYAQRSAGEKERIALINVCVDEEARGLGIGSRLLESFVKEHLQEAMELTVLADNEAAVKLYQKCGFTVVREELGFAFTEVKPRCFSMIRE